MYLHRWSAIIDSSRSVIKSFWIVLSRESKQKISHLEEEKRWKKLVSYALETFKNFSNIKLESLELQDISDVLKVVDAHQISLKRVEIIDGVYNCQALMNIFFSLSNLTTISLENCNSFKGFNDINVKPLINLKHVKLKKCILEILKLFTGSQLLSLKIYDIHTSEGQLLKNFLTTQTKLETLAINAMLGFFKDEFAPDNQSTFKLKNFTVSGFIFAAQEALLIKFFEAYGKHLQTLGIELVLSSKNQSQQQNSVYKNVFVNTPSLRRLTINAERFPKKPCFFERFPPMNSIKELIIVRDLKTESHATNVFGLFNNIESLSLDLITKATLKAIERSFPKLRCLKISMLPSTIDPFCVKFPHLKEFHVVNVGSVMNWILFLKHNPTIEIFSTKNIFLKQIKRTTVKNLTHSVNMRSIKLQGSREAMKNFFDLVKEKGWKKLESMELIETNDNDNTTRSFYFSLPRDNALWNKKYPL